MTNEQREAIEKLKERFEPNKFGGICVLGYKKKYCFGKSDLQSLDTVLSLIKEQEREIQRKDKIINEMIEEYEYNDGINTKKFCDEEIRRDKCIKNCTICMQEYFAGLVEKE